MPPEYIDVLSELQDRVPAHPMEVVRELVAGKDFMFNDRGETELRGFEDPVRLFDVRWTGDN